MKSSVVGFIRLNLHAHMLGNTAQTMRRIKIPLYHFKNRLLAPCWWRVGCLFVPSETVLTPSFTLRHRRKKNTTGHALVTSTTLSSDEWCHSFVTSGHFTYVAHYTCSRKRATSGFNKAQHWRSQLTDELELCLCRWTIKIANKWVTFKFMKKNKEDINFFFLSFSY